MEFKTTEQLHQFVIKTCQKLHPKDLDLIFISGSFARNEFTNYSDLDYTACVTDSFSHPIFKFFVAILDGTPRIVSIFFYRTSDLNITGEQLTEEHMLWEKGMMQKAKAKYIFGNEQLFNDICSFYEQATLKKEPKIKTIHKSTGKLLELIVKVRKFKELQNLPMMIYYGQKIAEHTRRLVFEFNDTLTLTSESKMLSAIKTMTNQPDRFGELYGEVTRMSKNDTNINQYLGDCMALVKNSLKFVQSNLKTEDAFTNELFASPIDSLLAHLH